jgi:hypothetical protein
MSEAQKALEQPTETPKSKGLIAKLCEVMAEAGYVEKRGHNDKFNYSYVTEADVVELLRDKLASRGVFIFPSVTQIDRKEHSKTSSGATMFITDIMMTWTFVDAETGETHVCHVPGCGTDTGDKGIYKAITGSSKYFFLKAFMLPTGDDPEDEKIDKEEGKAAARAVAVRKLKENANGNESVLLVPYKQNRLALQGHGVQILKAAMSDEDKAKVHITFTKDKVWVLPLVEGHMFASLCSKYSVQCDWQEEREPGSDENV